MYNIIWLFQGLKGLTFDMFVGTLTVFLINWLPDVEVEWTSFFLFPLALSNSLTATLCRSLSRVRMVSTAETPLVYFSMKVSPSPVSSSSWPEAAMAANDSLSSNSSLACKKHKKAIQLSDISLLSVLFSEREREMSLNRKTHAAAEKKLVKTRQQQLVYRNVVVAAQKLVYCIWWRSLSVFGV